MSGDVLIVKQQGQIGIVYGVDDGLLLMRRRDAPRWWGRWHGQGFGGVGIAVF